MEIKVLLFDFSRVLIFPKDTSYAGMLNDLYRNKLKEGNFVFFDNFKFNEELLSFLKTLKTTYSLDIFTTDVLQNDPAAKEVLKPIFSHVFSANELGLSKKDPQSYITISQNLEVKPEEVLFIDDTLGNIETAQKAGLQVMQFKIGRAHV